MLIFKQKTNLIPQFLLQILHFKESRNLIGQENFQTRTGILPGIKLAMGSQELKNFHIESFLGKGNYKDFVKKFKLSYFMVFFN